MSTEAVFATESATYADADAALRGVLRHVSQASDVAAVTTGADKVKDGTREQLGHSFIIASSRDRIVANAGMTLDLTVAVARFVWMVSGNNRLADIAFSEEKVRAFSDDGIIVPGSSYGMRIRQAHPGVDQLQGAISRLKQDPNSRRAAIVIWSALDAVRESNDIPCAFGMFFHIRGGRLQTQIVMRSNNATVLLPFNMFEFTMLAEVIAAEVGVEIGQVRYTAASMHTYEKLAVLTERIASDTSKKLSAPMEAMPADVFPQLERLVQFEAEMRHGSADINDASIADWISKAKEKLKPYWAQMALLLLVQAAKRNCSAHGHEVLKASLNSDYRNLVRFGAGKVAPSEHSIIGDLFTTHTVGENIINFPGSPSAELFKVRVAELERHMGTALTANETLSLQDRIFGRLAARGSSREGSISLDEMRQSLEAIRRGI